MEGDNVLTYPTTNAGRGDHRVVREETTCVVVAAKLGGRVSLCGTSLGVCERALCRVATGWFVGRRDIALLTVYPKELTAEV